MGNGATIKLEMSDPAAQPPQRQPADPRVAIPGRPALVTATNTATILATSAASVAGPVGAAVAVAGALAGGVAVARTVRRRSARRAASGAGFGPSGGRSGRAGSGLAGSAHVGRSGHGSSGLGSGGRLGSSGSPAGGGSGRSGGMLGRLGRSIRGGSPGVSGGRSRRGGGSATWGGGSSGAASGRAGSRAFGAPRRRGFWPTVGRALGSAGDTLTGEIKSGTAEAMRGVRAAAKRIKKWRKKRAKAAKRRQRTTGTGPTRATKPTIGATMPPKGGTITPKTIAPPRSEEITMARGNAHNGNGLPTPTGGSSELYQAARRFHELCAAYRPVGMLEVRNEAHELRFTLAEIAAGIRARVESNKKESLKPEMHTLYGRLADAIEAIASTATNVGPLFDDLHRDLIDNLLTGANPSGWDAANNGR